MSSSARRPFWLIAKRDNSRMKMLTMNPCGDKEALPVFSFKEEAEMFLRHRRPEKGWHVRETTAGELISVLYGPCASVERVVLDPPPEIFGEAVADLVSLRRERFVRGLMSKYEKIPDQKILDETTEETAIPDYSMWDFGR